MGIVPTSPVIGGGPPEDRGSSGPGVFAGFVRKSWEKPGLGERYPVFFDIPHQYIFAQGAGEKG